MFGSYIKLVVLLAAVLFHGLVAQPAWSQYQFGKIALSGDIAPGSGGSGADVPFTAFDEYVLNAVGEVAFEARTSANADGDNRGIFSTAGGALQPVAFYGQIAPGSGGSGADRPFIGFEDLLFNAAGEVAFRGGTEQNPEGYFIGLFSNVGGALQAEAFQGQIAPGSGGSGADVPFRAFGDPVLNDAGELAFLGSTSANADGNFNGIFSTVGGTLQTVAFTGQVAPGSGGSGTDVPFAQTFRVRPSLNAAGEVAFGFHTAANDDGGNSGIFSTAGGALHTVAFDGQIAPGSGGSGANVEFNFPILIFDQVALNAAGEVAFFASTSFNADFENGGVFSTTGGALQAVAFSGLIAPGSGGSGADVEFDFSFPLFDQVSLNDVGEMAFLAATDINADGGRLGIFSTAGGALNAVAFGQKIAPGSGGSGADVPFSFFGDPQLNAAGEVAFWAQTAVNTDGGDAGFFRSSNGVIEKVVFEGDQIEVAPGDFRIVEALSTAVSEQFSDLGQIAFRATFTDGSMGLFVATPVPEPSTTALALAGILGCCGLVSRMRFGRSCATAGLSSSVLT